MYTDGRTDDSQDKQVTVRLTTTLPAKFRVSEQPIVRSYHLFQYLTHMPVCSVKDLVRLRWQDHSMWFTSISLHAVVLHVARAAWHACASDVACKVYCCIPMWAVLLIPAAILGVQTVHVLGSRLLQKLVRLCYDFEN
jgi:hypothetical protein